MPHAVEKTQSGDSSTHQEIGPGQFRPEKIVKVRVTVRLVCRPLQKDCGLLYSSYLIQTLLLQNDIRPFNLRTEPPPVLNHHHHAQSYAGAPTSHTLERWLNEQTQEEYYHGQGNRIERLWN